MPSSLQYQCDDGFCVYEDKGKNQPMECVLMAFPSLEVVLLNGFFSIRMTSPTLPHIQGISKSRQFSRRSPCGQLQYVKNQHFSYVDVPRLWVLVQQF